MDNQPVKKSENLEQVLADINQGKTAPCYLLYGEEEYLIEEALNKITDLLVPAADRDLNLHFMEGQDERVEDICSALLTAPLIPGRKCVAVRDTQLFQSRKILPGLVRQIRDKLESEPERAAGYFIRFLKITGWKFSDLEAGGWKRISDGDWQKTVGDGGEEREKWLPRVLELAGEAARAGAEAQATENMEGLNRILAEGIPEDSHLILTAREVDKRKQLFKQISALGTVLYFPSAKKGKGQKFLFSQKAQELLAQSGKRLTPDAWEAIGGKTGFELRESMTALEKLITYAGDAKVIDAAAVEEVIGKTKEDSVFDLTGALVEKNLPLALAALRGLLEQGVHHLVVMKMLIREMRFLLYAKLLIMSGKIDGYNSAMDYSRFQTRIHPLIKALGEGDKGGLGSLAGLHPYVLYRLLKSSENFPRQALLKNLESLAEMDVFLRSTGRDAKLMIERFLAEVCL